MDCTSPSMLIGANWPKELRDDAFALDDVAPLAPADASGSRLDHTTGSRNVYKFGGTSVGSPERLGGLVRIVREERSRVLAVVVSAMGHTTDHLLEAVDLAVRGEQDSVERVVDQIQALTIANAHETQRRVRPQQQAPSDAPIDDMTELIVGFFKPLREMLFGISLLQEKTAAALDTVLSFGERISATVVARLLTAAGVDAVFVDAREWLTTDDTFGCAKVEFEVSKRALLALAPSWGAQLPVITGFIGRARSGRTTTLGRNGSDYTATLVGACLAADYVVINTDIAGVMTADPRIVERAVALSHLNHHEALELAVYGTRMFHARTMVPLIHGGVTMLIRNTMDPHGHGTYISSGARAGPSATCTTSLESLAIVEVRTRILQDGSAALETIGARITKLLEALRVPVWLAIRGAHGQAISVVIPMAMERAACAAIAAELQSELASDEVDPVNAQSPVTMLSVVAEDLSSGPHTQTKFFAALAHANVDVLAVGQGTSSRSLSCVIHGRDTKLAVRRVHDAFNVDHLVTNMVLLGCNHITLEVVRQLQQQQALYRQQHKAHVRVVGYGASCSAFRFEPAGIPLDELAAQLESCTRAAAFSAQTKGADGESYAGAPSLAQLDSLQDLPIPILVDCSAQSDTQELYAACIERGIHVVVSNAKSVSALPPTASRESVATSAKRTGRTFLMYTSTLGASVPVIDTLGHILRTGDCVLRIETSLSGSMGFVANEVMRGQKLSRAVRGALQRGFCERDPREDLTGRDSAAKIVVLARALGVKLDIDTIEIEPFVPASVLDTIDWSSDVAVDDIVEGIQRYDDIFHQRFYLPAVAQSKRLRFVASIDLAAFPAIRARIHPALVDESHPAYFTQDDEIAFGFSTLQYQPRPLVLKGTGTGAIASATGVLRDVLTILNALQQSHL